MCGHIPKLNEDGYRTTKVLFPAVCDNNIVAKNFITPIFGQIWGFDSLTVIKLKLKNITGISDKLLFFFI